MKFNDSEKTWLHIFGIAIIIIIILVIFVAPMITSLLNRGGNVGLVRVVAGTVQQPDNNTIIVTYHG